MWWWNGYGPGPWMFGPFVMIGSLDYLRSDDVFYDARDDGRPSRTISRPA